MRLGTKEFYEVMDMFEATAKSFMRFGYSGLERQPRDEWANKDYFVDSRANEAFKIYLIGYSAAKSKYSL